MTKPLWVPSQDRIDRANLSRFMRFVRSETGNADLNSYAPLYRFSVEQPAQFWTLLWDFVGIRASGDREPVVVADDGMASARWFPGVSLNVALNLLRFDDDRAAIRWIRPGADDVVVTAAELVERVAALAAALRARGVGPGDQVAAKVRAEPDALIAMLATASVGAAWFACPAHFDRAQLAPLLEALHPELLFATAPGDFDGLPVDGMPCILLGAGRTQPDTGLEAVLAAHAGATPDYAMVPFEHPLYLTCATGADGAAEVLVHGAGGTLMQHLKELVLHADLKREDRVYFQAGTDTMAWYWLASTLATGATLVLHDTHFAPGDAGLWDLVDEAGLTVLGLRADWLDAAAASGVRPRETHRLLSLKTVLTAGAPLAAASYRFVYEHVKDRVLLAPAITGTDTLACLAIGAPLLPVSAGEIPARALGMRIEVLADNGVPCVDAEGDLACTAPFPSMPLGFWNDVDGARYAAAFFARHAGAWCRGERARLTANEAILPLESRAGP
jgi:acetoacetyl-CoA synthetase